MASYKEGSVYGGKLAGMALLPLCLLAEGAMKEETERMCWIQRPLGLWFSFPSSRLCRLYIRRPSTDILYI